MTLKQLLKQFDVSLLLVETENCNLSCWNSGRIVEHRTLQTPLPYVWWFIQLTVATCFFFSLNWGTSIFQRILMFAGLTDYIPNWKTSIFPIRKSETFKSHYSAASRRRCKLEEMLWVDRLKLSMGQPLPDFELQCIKVKSNPVFPRQHKKVSRCYAFENFNIKLYISVLCERKQALFSSSRTWGGLRA